MEPQLTQTTVSPEPIARSPRSAPQGVARCRGRNRSGSRCRLHVQDPETGLCFRHAARLKAGSHDTTTDETDLSADLFGTVPAEFTTPEQINAVLAKIVLLLAQGRISPRRAAVITYACSLLLRSVVVIDRKGAGFSHLIIDIPRPDRSQQVPSNQPSPDSFGA